MLTIMIHSLSNPKTTPGILLLTTKLGIEIGKYNRVVVKEVNL